MKRKIVAVKERPMTYIGRMLGVDYGDVRTGVAVSDALGMLATALTTLKCGGMRRTAEAVAECATRENAVKIVVGLPKNMDGSEGFRADTVKNFVAILKELTSIPIELSDERLTTVEAHRFLSMTDVSGKKRKASVDMLSAEIIVQDYLDRTRKKSSEN